MPDISRDRARDVEASVGQAVPDILVVCQAQPDLLLWLSFYVMQAQNLLPQMNTDKHRSFSASVFICVHPWFKIEGRFSVATTLRPTQRDA